MAEITVEYLGAGFVHPYPGEYANCQVVFDEDTLTPLRVEPLGTPPPEQVSNHVDMTANLADTEQENQGG